MPGRGVRAHQYLIAHSQAGMHNLVAPFRWHVFRRRRTLVRRHCFDFAAKDFLVEPERGFAVSMEHEIWIQLHRALLECAGMVGTKV